MKNGVLTAEAARGIALKWRYDTAYAAFEPILATSSQNPAGIWFYAYNYGAYPSQSAFRQGSFAVALEIYSFVSVPQPGAPAQVHLRPYLDPQRERVIAFPFRERIEDRIEDALLSQSKERRRGLWRAIDDRRIKNVINLRVPHR